MPTAHCNGYTKVSQGLGCVAGAALLQDYQVQILWQAQRFREVRVEIEREVAR